MKLNGEFVIRQITDDILAVPVGPTALKFNGMIMLNQVSKLIWNCLEQDTDLDALTAAVTEHFEVSEETARADIQIFLQQLREVDLLIE
jgi:hypothetical protein